MADEQPKSKKPLLETEQQVPVEELLADHVTVLFKAMTGDRAPPPLPFDDSCNHLKRLSIKQWYMDDVRAKLKEGFRANDAVYELDHFTFQVKNFVLRKSCDHSTSEMLIHVDDDTLITGKTHIAVTYVQSDIVTEMDVDLFDFEPVEGGLVWRFKDVVHCFQHGLQRRTRCLEGKSRLAPFEVGEEIKGNSQTVFKISKVLGEGRKRSVVSGESRINFICRESWPVKYVFKDTIYIETDPVWGAGTVYTISFPLTH